MLEMSESAVCEAISRRIKEMLDSAISQIVERAKEAEDYVLRTVAGKENTPSSIPSHSREAVPRLRERVIELRGRMNTLRDRILQSNVPQVNAAAASQSATVAAIPSEPAPAAEEPPVINEGDIARDLRTRGCPVCDRACKAMFHFFAHWQYELYGNEQSQNLYAVEGGLCPLHTWQLAAIASPQGISQGYPRLIERIARELAHLTSTDVNPAWKIASFIQTSSRCRACRELRTAESAYLDKVMAFLRTGQGCAAYEHSQGLCLRHLGLLLSRNPPPDLQQRVLRHASRILSAMAEDMQSYTLKRDALRRFLHNQDEDDAYMRALIHLAGARYLAVPWKASEE